MPEKTGPTFESLSKQLTAAQDRAHKSGERAAQQFVKLLGTVLGGFGVAIAAWLQRIFEQSGHGAPSPLAWYLAVALFFVALGLAALVLTAIIDQRSANHAAKSTILNTERTWNHMERAQLLGLDLPRDEKSAKELALAVDDGDLIHKIESADASANRLNTFSEGLGLASWICLIAAFVSMGIGIINALECFSR